MHRNNQRPQDQPRNAMAMPKHGAHILITQHTQNAPEPCSVAHARPGFPPSRVRQTLAHATPRTSRMNPKPRTRIAASTGLRPPESSCAPRSAPEPDSHCHKDQHPARTPHAPLPRPRTPSTPNPNRNHDKTTQAHTRTGGGGRDRTDDPLLAKQVLSQLSYAPNHAARTHAEIPPQNARRKWWAREDLNLRPHAYQACALTS